MKDDFAIKVDHVSKSFKLPHERQSSLKSALINFHKRGYEKQEVLKDIDFEIKQGEFFGIVGRNGSGKSTLLKLLAGIYAPEEGQVHIRGKLTPFIELGVGFNPELTGRENVYLNGALLGFNRKEMEAKYDEIVAFAELGRFMDQKLKNYSSGMQVRLAFSVAIRANTDILLIDEVLAVGDQSFQEKCFDYFAKIKRSGKTVVFVTHDMSNVERFCDRVYVIDKKKEVNGLYTIPDAVSLYNQLNHEPSRKGTGTMVNKKSDTNQEVFISKVELLDKQQKVSASFNATDPLKIRISIASNVKKGESLPLQLGLAFYDKDGTNLAGPNTSSIDLRSDNSQVSYILPALPFNMGEYRLTLGLYNKDGTKQYDYLDKEMNFFVNTKEVYYGKYILEGTWEL